MPRIRVRLTGNREEAMPQYFKSLKLTKDMVLEWGSSQSPGVDNPRCQMCGVCSQTYYPFTYPLTHAKAKLLFIVAQPSEEEQYSGTMGDGRNWNIVLSLAERFDIPVKQIAYYSAVLCGSQNGRINKKQGDMCRPFVSHLIQKSTRYKPLIVAMGAEAAKQVLQREVVFADLVGTTQDTAFGKVLITYSPAMIFRPDPMDQGGGVLIGYFDMMKRHLEHFINNVKLHSFPDMEVLNGS